MGGQFSPYDPLRCPHYAQFASDLDRIHFDGIYWAFFFIVVCILFAASWIYQSTMMYREKRGFCEDKFRRKVKIGLGWCTGLFLVAVVLLVIEVYALLALQFCDGEDLMAMYWATWTMLQLGSGIAILGIDLALWHHLSNVRLPAWALALGTPVLVVAGFGHVIQVALRMLYKRTRARKRANGAEPECGEEDTAVSTPSTDGNQPELTLHDWSDMLESGRYIYFVMDMGDDERARRWPCFAGLGDGKTIVRLIAYTGNFPRKP